MIELVNKLKSDKRFQPVKELLLFATLLFSVHYLYIWWSGTGFYPFAHGVEVLFNKASKLLFNQGHAVLEFLNVRHYYTGQTYYITSLSGEVTWLEVSPGCTSLKQWMHWIFLIALYPGPRLHKLWYIPFGVIVIHFINLVRITGLGITLKYWPTQFDFAHDYIFKTMFYGVIFLMWVIWVEKFKNGRKI
jgi:exosortase/archaeosortase family protein